MALALAGPAAASGPAPVTPVDQAAVARASARGTLMFAYDQAAWHGTDAMLAQLPDASATVGGYIVDGLADAPRLVFYDKSATRAVYVAQFDGGRLASGRVLGTGDDTALSAIDRRLIGAVAAARTALAADKAAFTCTAKPFNTVVLPPETPDGPVAVYFLTPQVSNDAIPFGGHYEIDVDAAGHAGPVRAFSRSCIAAPTHPALPAGATPTMFVISDPIDATPTEVHVFSSLALRLPVGVLTTTPMPRLWPVMGARIAPPLAVPAQ